MQFHFTNRGQLSLLLAKLQPDTAPNWGTLDAQHMIEHLVTAMDYTNGRFTTVLEHDEERAAKSKKYLIYTDAVMPMNITAPGIVAIPENYRFENLEQAIVALNESIDAFELHFREPGIIEMHPGLGALNHEEWIIFHTKHFTHHFTQFGLLP